MFQSLRRMVGVLVIAFFAGAVHAQLMTSPNGRIMLTMKDNGYAVFYNQQLALDIASIGYDTHITPKEPTSSQRIMADYEMISGKRSHCVNTANEYSIELDHKVTLLMRVYDDGIAFRYEWKGLNNSTIPRELTAYRIPERQKRWMQQWSDAYEGYFPPSTTAKVKSEATWGPKHVDAEGNNCRWGYPALLQPGDNTFVLLTEANIERKQSASFLTNDGELFYVEPDKNELWLTGQWHTPWRVAIIGSLSTLVSSTLVTDVSEPCKLKDTSWIHPGPVSWIYWAHNHGSNDYNIICQYVDMAATLHLPYVLIDAEWDEMKDGKTIEEALAYARSKGIKPLIWYNSSIGWVDGAPGPKYRLNDPNDMEREMAWCESQGIAGVKIDFFSGDNQENMDYCIDLLECAARHHLLVNFHGATIPRGWQRTYPHLLSTEGVLGAEWYNNGPILTDRAASHNATLPFTRNVVGPMDYTPCAFSDSQHPHITTHAHELALTALFESGLQHLADRPESFLSQPEAVQQFLGELPTAWDDTKFVGGYPGQYAVLARRSGDTWYVAGINGTDRSVTISLALSSLTRGKSQYQAFLDSGDSTHPWNIQTKAISELPSTITCQARGGFLLKIK